MAVQAVQPSTPIQRGSINSLTQQTVTQDDFLKLLITQLQNQDPLQPMDNQQFAAQLATFNSLGQLIDINSKLGTMQNSQAALNQYNAASLIGKEIASDGNQINLISGTPATVGFRLGANATKVVVSIFNGAGQLVRRIDGGALRGGDQSLIWDGKDSAGNAALPGAYGFNVSAFDVNGKQISATGNLRGVVTGVKLAGTEPVLEVGGMDVPLSGVTTVRAVR